MDGYGDFIGFTLALDWDSRHTGESRCTVLAVDSGLRRNDEFRDAYCDFAGFTLLKVRPLL